MLARMRRVDVSFLILEFHISSVFYVHAFSFEAGARMVVRVCVGEFVSAIEAT